MELTQASGFSGMITSAAEFRDEKRDLNSALILEEGEIFLTLALPTSL